MKSAIYPIWESIKKVTTRIDIRSNSFLSLNLELDKALSALALLILIFYWRK
jgi:hypothetical protein